MSCTAREFSHAAKRWLLFAVAKVTWENITSVSLRRNPWNKVLLKPFRITETSNCSRRRHLCRFHKNLSIVLLARWHSERWNIRWNTKNTLTESVRGFIFTCSYSKSMITSPVSLTVCKAKIPVFRTLSTRHFYCLRSSLFCFRLNSSTRNKTGTHVFWGNGVDYTRVSPGTHPLAKKPEDSGYEIVEIKDRTVLVSPLTNLFLITGSSLSEASLLKSIGQNHCPIPPSFFKQDVYLYFRCH